MAMNPIIKFTTLFGLLAVELAVTLTAERGRGLQPLRSPPSSSSISAGLRLAVVLRHAHPVGSGTRRDREGAGPPRKLRSRAPLANDHPEAGG